MALFLGQEFFNIVNNTEIISLLGEIGVVFLLFFLGLEFSIHKLLKQKKTILIAGSIDLIINFSFGLGLGILLGLNIFFSVVLAGAIYMSSSGIITKSLIELKVNKKREGNIVMGIMVFEDFVMILFLVIILSGIKPGEQIDIIATLVQILISILFCGTIIFIAKKAHRFLDKILAIKNKELLLLIFFGVVLLLTSIGKILGISEALVAFLLGIAFSNTENVKNIESMTITFRDLFGSVFFFSFGMMLKFDDMVSYINIIAICLIVAIAGKLLSSFLISKVLKCETNMGLFMGFITMPRGEFSLLISKMSAASIAFIGPVMIVLAILTTIISSLVLRFSKILCKVYNLCFIYPRKRIEDDNWGEMD